MWEQARARAEEAGSMVLFCDGGDQGASGVAGQGLREPLQFGSGSWMRSVGVQWPFNQRRTLHMWGGEAVHFTVVWSLLGVGLGAQVLALRLARGPNGDTTVIARLREFFGRLRARVQRRAPRGQGERQALLL